MRGLKDDGPQEARGDDAAPYGAWDFWAGRTTKMSLLRSCGANAECGGRRAEREPGWRERRVIKIIRLSGKRGGHFPASSVLRAFLISAASNFSSGKVNRYSEAITLLGNPSKAYLATAAFFSAHKISPTGGFSSGLVQCSRS